MCYHPAPNPPTGALNEPLLSFFWPLQKLKFEMFFSSAPYSSLCVPFGGLLLSPRRRWVRSISGTVPLSPPSCRLPHLWRTCNLIDVFAVVIWLEMKPVSCGSNPRRGRNDRWPNGRSFVDFGRWFTPAAGKSADAFFFFGFISVRKALYLSSMSNGRRPIAHSPSHWRLTLSSSFSRTSTTSCLLAFYWHARVIVPSNSVKHIAADSR